jgi:hypothetical protein
MVRKDSDAFRPAAVAAVCYATAMVVFLLLVNPMNSAMKAIEVEAAPPGWEVLRNQWEYGHLFRFLLQVTGLGALLVAFVRPERREPRLIRREMEMRRPAAVG